MAIKKLYDTLLDLTEALESTGSDEHITLRERCKEALEALLGIGTSSQGEITVTDGTVDVIGGTVYTFPDGQVVDSSGEPVLKLTYLTVDTRANQPAASVDNLNNLYYVSDEEVIEYSDGAAWVQFSISKVRVEELISESISGIIQTPTGSFVQSGCAVLWIQNFDFAITPGVFYINGVRFVYLGGTVTLDAADADDDRIDIIGVDNTNTEFKITGTPATPASEPSVDPASQLQLAFVSVPEDATEPPGVAVEDIYIDNAEWTSSTSGSGWDADSAVSPINGTKSILGTAVANGAYVQLQNGSPIDINSYNFLAFKIKNTVAWNNNRSLLVQFLSSGVLRGQVVLDNGLWGFDHSSILTQTIAIPTLAFGIVIGVTVNQLRIVCSGTGGTFGTRIDDILLQASGGLTIINNNGLTQDQADARYIRLGNAVNADLANITAMPNFTVPLLTLSQGARIPVNRQILAGTLTLLTTDERYNNLDPNGASRDVNLPVAVAGEAWFFNNWGTAGEILTIKASTGTTIIAIDAEEGASIYYDGTQYTAVLCTGIVMVTP